jgi:CMP-N-acetylneuraminic acid synthetase
MCMDIAGVIQVRAASERCKRKNLRPFGDTNLTVLALKKYVRSTEISNLYLAAYEEELISMAEPFERVTVIRRTRESAYGEDIPTVLNYVSSVKEDTIAFINTSTPFLKLETFDNALKEFRTNSYRSMMPVFATYAWYFDETGKPINNDLSALRANTKMLKPIYRSSSAFVVASKSRILNEHTYWSLTPGDPSIYPIDEVEAFDIDTEVQFRLAEALYKLRSAGKGWNTGS